MTVSPSADLKPGELDDKLTPECGHTLVSFLRRSLSRCFEGIQSGFSLADSPKKADKATLKANWYRVFSENVRFDASDLRLAGMSEDDAAEGLGSLERTWMSATRSILGEHRLCKGLISKTVCVRICRVSTDVSSIASFRQQGVSAKLSWPKHTCDCQ